VFVSEFFTIVIIIVACFAGYKFRHSILQWLNKKPTPVTKRGVLRDLDVLQRYNVEDAITRIVTNERAWAEDEANLEKQLRQMKDEIHQKYHEKQKEVISKT